MAEIYYYEHPLTYEDCGVLGGRTIFHSGTEFNLMKDTSIVDFLGEMVVDAQEMYQKDHIYPFQRFGICLFAEDGGLYFAYTEADDLWNSTFTCRYFSPEEEEVDSSLVETLLSAYNIQIYDVLIQTSEGTIKVVGYKTPKSKEKYGRAYDVFRCLDIRGICRILNVSTSYDFHNYIRYELGEDFFIEAYDNPITEHREFWLGREFGFQKNLLVTFDFDDRDYSGFFDEKGHLIIDAHIADHICRLTDKHEFVYIDNEYRLNTKGLKMDGDEI